MKLKLSNSELVIMPVFFILMFLSGFSALVYQVVWQRVLTQEIGIDSISIAIIVSIFMLGLGFGAVFGGQFTKFGKWRLPVVYAGIEFLIGAYGFFSIDILRVGNQWIAEYIPPSLSTDFLVNSVLLFFPIFLMGMTTPIVMSIVRHSLGDVGRLIGIYYGINVIGAAVGAVATGLALIEWGGLSGAVAVAVAVNIAIAAIALFTFYKTSVHEVPGCEPAPSHEGVMIRWRSISTQYKIAILCFGFSTLAMQMIIFRIMIYAFMPLPTVFPIILAFYLVFMALGEFVFGFVIDLLKTDSQRKHVLYALLLGSIVSVGYFSSFTMDEMISGNLLLNLKRKIPVLVAAMLPVAFLSGYFPLLVKVLTHKLTDIGANFGMILGLSTFGNVMGVIITVGLLFGLAGTWMSILIVLLIVLIGCLFASGDVDGPHEKSGLVRGLRDIFISLVRALFFKPWVSVSVLALSALALVLPYDFYKQNFLDFHPIGYYEGSTTVVTALPHGENYVDLYASRRHSALAGLVEPDNVNKWNGSHVMVVDPDFRPRKVLQIGIGEGTFHYAMKDIPSVEQITVVEISPEVIKAWKDISMDRLAKSLDGPKVKLIIADGRRYMREALGRGEKFDLIQIGVQGPQSSGASNIYTIESFELARQLLSDNGYIAAPSYIGVIRTGVEVFESSFWFRSHARAWVWFGKKKMNLEPEITRAIPPWLGWANTVSVANSKPLDKFLLETSSRPVTYPSFEIESIDRVWLKDNYRDVNTDNNIVMEYNLLARNSDPDFKQMQTALYRLEYKGHLTKVNVVDERKFVESPSR